MLDPYLLARIDWSDIDQLYRRNRERIKDLSFQKFCSEGGFMRYFPGIFFENYDSFEDEIYFSCAMDLGQ